MEGRATLMNRTVNIFVLATLLVLALVACGGTATAPEKSTENGAEIDAGNTAYIELRTGQEASLIIGQSTFEASGEDNPTMKIGGAYGKPLVVDGVLYLPDQDYRRVLGYASIPAEAGAEADFVIGRENLQDLNGDFAGDYESPTRVSLGGPGSVFTDGVNLYVVDSEYSRILRYTGFPGADSQAANLVIGQANFESGTSSVGPTQLATPADATIADGKLIVADTFNNRVLIWETVPTRVNTEPDIVLGQLDLTTRDRSDPAERGSFFHPTSVWSDGERLLVSDYQNNRVLLWHNFPANGEAMPDVVLGQVDFETSRDGSSASEMHSPAHVTSNGTQIFVSDAMNNRVLVWNEFPTQNGQAANVILGQTVSGHSSPNNAQAGPNSIGFDNPSGLLLHENTLYVGDVGNGRYLVFEGAAVGN